MANEIVIKVRLDEDGSLKQVEQSAKKAAKATDDLGKSRNRYNKGEKGVIGATANGTKAFSKMRESMTGSTGLVSAYAVLASNVFAATAAFNAFRRAAQVEQLEKGLIAVGAAAGRNLGAAADGLRRITGEAISAEQAMRSTALATASGFRSDQLNNLAKVARGASLALGRDMGDALDRLVRGTAKVEPEILDELGIFVRLDDAVRDYANELNVAESSLTQYDRSQAFLNATIEEGLKKYNDLSERIDPNPYDKLSAALADLQKNALGFVNGFLKLGDVVGFASRNLGSLAAVATTLGGAVTSTVAPGLLRMAESSAEGAEGLFQARSEMARTLVTGKGLPPKFKELADKLEDGSASAKDFGSAQASLLGKMGATQKQINLLSQELDENGNVSAKAQKEIDNLTNTKSDYANRLAGLKELQVSQTEASIAASRASAIQNATSLNLVAAFKDLGQAHEEDKQKTREGTKEKKGFGKALKNLGPTARTAAGGMKILGAAFFTVLPYIGLIISGISILYGIIKEKFFPEDIVKNRIDEAIESFEFFSEISTNFFTSTSEGADRMAESYIALSGILGDIRGQLAAVNDTVIEDIKNQGAAIDKEIRANAESIASIEANPMSGIGETSFNRALMVGGANMGALMATQAQAAVDVEKNTAALREKNLELEEKRLDITSQIVEAQRKAAKPVIKAAIESLRIQTLIADAANETTAFNTAAGKRVQKELGELYESFTRAENPISFDQFIVEYAAIQREFDNIKNDLQTVNEAASTVRNNINKRQRDAETPFAQDIKDAESLVDRFKTLESRAGESVAATFETINNGTAGFTAEAKEAQMLIEKLNEEIKGMGFEDGVEGVKQYIKDLTTAEENLERSTKKIKEQRELYKSMSNAVRGLVGGQAMAQTLNNELLDKEISHIDDKIAAEAIAAKMTEEAYLRSAEGVKLEAERNKLAEQKLKPEEISAKLALEEFKLKQQTLNLQKEQVKNDLRLMKIQQMATRNGITPADEVKFSVQAAKNTVLAAKIDLQLMEKKFALQRALIKAQLEADNVGIDRQNEILGLLDAELKVQRQIANEKIRGAQIGVSEAITGGITTTTAAQRTGGYQGTEVFDAVVEGGQRLGAAQARESAATTDLADAEKEAGLLATMNRLEGSDETEDALAKALERVKTAKETLLIAQQEVKQAGIQMVVDTLNAQNQVLMTMGPEGAIAAGFGNMMNIMLTSVTTALQTIEQEGINSAEGLAAGFAAASAVIGGIAQILSAQADAQVKKIDKQIEAEKKRDGKSKESLAKIKQMEAKKESIKKKAFETDKKLKMAQTVTSTAAAIMQTLATGGYFAIPLAAIIGAMGAAQLAIISGMTYDGGGAGASSNIPSSISMGDRRTSTDLARSQSARGELAYFRGEAGSGGPENFKNAFGGYRNRAAGGNTSFMVGEQGPELFVPETPGTIVPNDEVAQATPTNVNFTISAVDAAGVEDLLIRQQGNIIGMIREAANSYGQDFVETVDTSVFNDTTGGVSRY